MSFKQKSIWSYNTKTRKYKKHKGLCQAARDLNISPNIIWSILDGRQKRHKNYMFCRGHLTKPQAIKKVKELKEKSLKKPVSSYTKNGLFVKKYESLTQAAIDHGTSPWEICSASKIEGEKITCRNLFWVPSSRNVKNFISTKKQISKSRKKQGILKSIDTKKKNPKGKLIKRIDPKNNKQKIYPSIKKAAEDIGINYSTFTSYLIKNQNKSNKLYRGYLWKIQ